MRQHAGKIQVLGLDFTHLKCRGEDRILAVATAVLTGATLTFDLLETETAFHAEKWIRDLTHTIGAEVVVTDDADGLKTVTDDLGVQHQICRAPVNRNVHDLIATLGEKALAHPDPVPWELKAIDVSADQFLEDLQTAAFVIVVKRN